MFHDWFQDVLEFHRKFAPERIGSRPDWPDEETARLGTNLVEEEFLELFDADDRFDLVETADATVDLIYVLLGRLVTFGIDPRPVWEAVHAANMAKVGGSRRSDGKVLKPPGWVAPDVAAILEKQPPLVS